MTERGGIQLWGEGSVGLGTWRQVCLGQNPMLASPKIQIIDDVSLPTRLISDTRQLCLRGFINRGIGQPIP